MADVARHAPLVRAADTALWNHSYCFRELRRAASARATSRAAWAFIEERDDEGETTGRKLMAKIEQNAETAVWQSSRTGGRLRRLGRP